MLLAETPLEPANEVPLPPVTVFQAVFPALPAAFAALEIALPGLICETELPTAWLLGGADVPSVLPTLLAALPPAPTNDVPLPTGGSFGREVTTLLAIALPFVTTCWPSPLI